MVSMKDVARLANVSVGTVSGVLNGKKAIKPANVEKVLAAVEELGYRPNMLARSLRTNVSNSIGLIIPDITNPYYPELARGVEDAAHMANFTLFLCNSDRSAEKEWYYAQALVQKKVDGMIIVKPRCTLEQLKRLKQSCKLVLADGTDSELEEFDLINVDNKAGAVSAVNLLLTYGHRDIAFIGGIVESQSAKHRLEAYQATLACHNIPYRPELVRECMYDWRGGRVAAQSLLTSNGPKPTAIFVGNDILAFGVIRGIYDCGLRVPEDISVCGFDDIAMSELSIPALTTVRQPKYEVGRQSAELLLQRIQTDSSETVHKVLDTSVIFRNTVSRSPIRKIYAD